MASARRAALDEDTCRLLQISEHFLVTYFGNSEDEARSLVDSFVEQHGDRFDEDFLHHEGAYRVAAAVHFIEGLKGAESELGRWLIDNGYNGPTPREALEYIEEHYFRRD